MKHELIDPETYRTWDDIVTDEIEHQATKRLARTKYDDPVPNQLTNFSDLS